MAVGLSDGTSYPDSTQWLASVDSRTNKQRSDQSEINQNSMSGDFESRFNASDASTMPPQASTELAGALKQSVGIDTPGMLEKVKNRLFGTGGEDRYITWPEHAINSAIDAFKLPGDALAGKVDPMSDEGRERALNLAETLIFAPAPLASKMADGTLGSFAGVKSAKNMNKLNDLGHAQVLEADAVHPDEVFKQTGFFRGADSRWRYEIDDSKSVFDKDWVAPPLEVPGVGTYSSSAKVSNLSDVLDHPELYKAYPHLKDVQVKYDPEHQGIASWNNSNTITMGDRAFTEHDPHGIVMHEVQHAIQDFEGFAKGGRPGIADVDYSLKYGDFNPSMAKAKRQFLELHDKLKTDGLTEPEMAEYKRLATIGITLKRYKEAGNSEAFINYEKLAGETEARNVDTRLLMTAAERRRVPPRVTEEYNPRDQIISNKPILTTAYTGKLESKLGLNK